MADKHRGWTGHAARSESENKHPSGQEDELHAAALAELERLHAARPEAPYLDDQGGLRIPCDCEPKYRWQQDGQSPFETALELGASDEELAGLAALAAFLLPQNNSTISRKGCGFPKLSKMRRLTGQELAEPEMVAARLQGCSLRKRKPRSAGGGRSVTLKIWYEAQYEVKFGGVNKCRNHPETAERRLAAVPVQGNMGT